MVVAIEIASDSDLRFGSFQVYRREAWLKGAIPVSGIERERRVLGALRDADNVDLAVFIEVSCGQTPERATGEGIGWRERSVAAPPGS